MSNRSLIAFLCFFAFTFGFTSETLKVKLNHGGVLVGRHLESSEGRHIRAFLGIPYAKPPLDDLRFKSPQPYPSWKGEKLAIKDGPFCLQVDPYLRTSGPEGEEDCLYLNVYTPPLKDIKDPLPVIVWFHGGGWESGSGGELFYGPQFLLNRDVILVSGNYRLGPLGFLSTESLECPGNFGLKDQVEILRWVKENIHSFGGNASSITIAGESAGGATVSYLMHSEKSKGLFHKAILESGNFHNPWAQPMHEGEAFKRAMKLAKMFNCEESNKIIYCLRKVPGKDIIARFNEFFEWDIYPMIPFQPVVEVEHPEAFLTENPKETGLRSLDIPVLTGCNSGEGIIMSSFLLNNQEVMGELKSQVNKLFPIIFNYDHWSQDKQEEITKAIEGFYFKNGHVYEKETHQNFTGLYTDAYALFGFDEFLEKRVKSSSTAPTFAYIFDHRAPASISEVVGGGSDYYYGVSHADELQYLFPLARTFFPSSIPSERDVILRKAMVDMWVNFATYGNPTPPGSSLPKWSPTTKYPWNFAKIGSTDSNSWHLLENLESYARERLEFWKKMSPFRKNDEEFCRNEL